MLLSRYAAPWGFRFKFYRAAKNARALVQAGYCRERVRPGLPPLIMLQRKKKANIVGIPDGGTCLRS